MARRRRNKSQTKWIILGIALVLLVGFGLLKNNGLQPPPQEAGYQVYQNPMFDFSIEYPKEWEIRKETQVFENGDAIAFRLSGPTQKENTELTDGAQVVVSKPFIINTDLAAWVKEYFSNQSEFSQNTINGRSFEKIYNCSGVGCMTYYYTLKNSQVFGVAVFAEGEDKMVYENAIVYMLKSLKFTDAENGSISKDEAVTKVKAQPEVADYLKRVPNGLVLVNGEEDNAYMIQVYEFKNDHTATFNWYNVNKTTGAVEKEF